MLHSLRLYIDILKMLQVTHGYTQKLIKMPYLTYVQSDIQIVVPFEL